MKLIGHEKIRADFEELLKKDALASGYIFFGPEGVGKKQFALSLARFIEQGSWDKEEGMPILSDFEIIEKDEKGSIGIDKARDIKNFLWQSPLISEKKTLVIDNADFLTDEAQNALLKITEEPSVHSLIILITSDPEGLRIPLRSRLKKVYFGPISKKSVEHILIENFGIETKKASSIAEVSHGSPGIAVRVATDKEFQELLSSAKKFLQSKDLERKNFIKELVKDEDFDLLKYVDAIAIVAAASKSRPPAFWHTLLELKRDASLMGLNSRIQLMALSSTLR